MLDRWLPEGRGEGSHRSPVIEHKYEMAVCSLQHFRRNSPSVLVNNVQQQKPWHSGMYYFVKIRPPEVLSMLTILRLRYIALQRAKD
jgi:hypothetical protein